jgi:alanine-glyoxylate transaminase/serine-glyoxylate transaminase/serine-pyruvate transaminase
MCLEASFVASADSFANRWLPIMQAYEAGTAAYFATPPVNLIYAYHASLSQITEASPSLEERFKLHVQVSDRLKGAIKELGLKQVPLEGKCAANGMTAVSQERGSDSEF